MISHEISDPIDGAHHDTHCLRESGALPAEATDNRIGDKGYVGNGMITPYKKPLCRNLTDWEKSCNAQINEVRYVIDQVIANFKTWRIMRTDYRRPLSTFTTKISTVVGLHFCLTG
ncbi:MAG: transposase family protein [Pseudonocardiaceae bacterium]